MITFKGKYIQTTYIERKGIDNKMHRCKTSFVELRPDSYEDFLSLNIANCNWDDCNTYLHDIAKLFNSYYHDKNKKIQHKFFAITSQEDHFEKLNARKILGVTQTKNKKKNIIEIEFLQTNPNTKFKSPDRKFRQVGERILDVLKLIYPKKDLILEADDIAIPFYKKNGFKLTGKKTFMIFKR